MITTRMGNKDIYDQVARDASEICSFIIYEALPSAKNKVKNSYKTIMQIINNNLPLSRRVFISKTGVEYNIVTTLNSSLKGNVIDMAKKKVLHLYNNNDANIYEPNIYVRFLDSRGRENYLYLCFTTANMPPRVILISPHMLSRYRERLHITENQIISSNCKNIFEYFMLHEFIKNSRGTELLTVMVDDINKFLTENYCQTMFDMGITGNFLHENENMFYLNINSGMILTNAVDIDGDNLMNAPKMLIVKTYLSTDIMSHNSLCYKAVLDVTTEQFHQSRNSPDTVECRNINDMSSLAKKYFRN